ncbi:MAG: GntR family transcriptional regulator [Vicinamibacteraceae bacterium]
MLPFSLTVRPGEPIVEQIVYAVTRAVVSGQLRAGDRFPSVRTLSQELKVNPNTAQRIVALLVEAGLLAVEPGVGTVVTNHRQPTAGGADAATRRSDLAALEERLAEPLVVEARRLGIGLADLVEIVRRQWKRLDQSR